jgi:hypothetical protein
MDKIKLSEDFSKEAKQIIEIKHRYEDKYPDLKQV